MAPDPRDELAEAVQYGRMTPNEAESKLKELGLSPLAPQPDPANFNPMEEVWWTLPMTVAWIAWRTNSEVRDAWDRFRCQGSFWEHRRWQLGFSGPIHEGWHQQPRRPANLSGLALTEIFRRREGTLPRSAISLAEAKEALWNALRVGALQATGISTESSSLATIPDIEWRDLAPIETSGRDVVRHRERHGYSSRGYDKVEFRRQNIMSIWQPSRIAEQGVALPPTMSPHEPGFMPLYCAAQWIATRGGTFSFEPHYQPIWQHAYSELLARIASGDVMVTAFRDGRPEKLEGYMFAGIAISYPFADTDFDVMTSNELHLSSYAYGDEAEWRKGIDDSLDDQRGRQWTRIMVANADVARWWPFEAPPRLEPSGSGAPGRPTSMHLVELEYAARWERGEVRKRIGEEADVLTNWLAMTHPREPQLTPKTIANNLRGEHRQRWQKARK